MPVEGVDTFSCLGVPDLECAISGATDDDVVSHLRWPYAARVAHQRSQTLKRPETKKSPNECFQGKSWPFISNLLLLCLLREPSNCFHRKGWLTEYRKLVIDSHSSNNRSAQLNLHSYASYFARWCNYSAFHWSHSGRRRLAHAGGGWRVAVVGPVRLTAERRWGVQHLTSP